MTDVETRNEGPFRLTGEFDEETFGKVYDWMTGEERDRVDGYTRTAASALNTLAGAHQQRTIFLNRKWSEMSRDKRPVRDDEVSTTASLNQDESASPSTGPPTGHSSKSPGSFELPPTETSDHLDNVSGKSINS
jgi:hypothetical protein